MKRKLSKRERKTQQKAHRFSYFSQQVPKELFTLNERKYPAGAAEAILETG